MILIDYKDRRPIYEQVVEKLSELMLRGILEQNSQLPSVRSLATELSINPNTIQRAYAELERQGYIYSVKGRGSFVAENHQIREQKKKEIFVRLGRLVEEARGTGVTMLQFQEQVIQFYGSSDRRPRPAAGTAAPVKESQILPAAEARGRKKEEKRMIEAINLTKRFDDIKAVDHINAVIREGSVFGLIGTNGAGKSTFLRMAAGILKPDEGRVTIDGEDIFENDKVKSKFFYISDEQYFLNNATPGEMMKFYRNVYRNFDEKRFFGLLSNFDLDARRKVNTFSKGMKKQLSVLLGICANTDYIFCDETFDGLDPVMRQTVKSLFANDMEERNLTPIIASHNLRELEDICDHVGLLHKGGILLSKDLDDMKLNIHKVQCVLLPGTEPENLHGIDIIRTERRGSLLTLTIRGKKEEIEAVMQTFHPVFFELIPLSLEEIFISETEVAGYDIKKLIL